MKKLLILGAGTDQVPLIRKAQKMGCIVIVASPRGYVGLRLADEVVNVDVRDKEAVLRAAKEKGVDGVVSDQLDIAVPTVAYVAERLNLPGNSYETARLFTNKYLMRQKCSELGIPTPHFGVFSRHEGALNFARSVGFPVVIKPVDFTGSRGVQTIHQEDGFEGRLVESLELSKSGSVIVEEFIFGEEYMSQGFVENGSPFIFAFAERSKFNLEYISIFNRTVFSESIPSNLKMRMNDYHSAMIKSTELSFGCTMAEWIHSAKDEEVYLVEAAIRGAGVRLTSDLIPLAYGVDPQQYLLRHALAEEGPQISEAELKGRASGYMTFLLPEGKIAKVAGVDEVASLPKVHAAEIDVEVSDTSGPTRHKGSRNGPILVHGASKGEVLDVMSRVEEGLDIQVDTSSGLKGAIFH